MINTGNTAWLLMSSGLVMLMTVGLSLFYTGLVPARNAINTLKMSFICMAIVPLAWTICGFTLALSDGNSFIGDLRWVGLSGLDKLAPGMDVPEYAYMTFQMMFAIIAPALISGSLVGRMRFKPYTLFIGLWSILIYCPIAHWVWSQHGFLTQIGAIDFAGGTVVHISAGFSGLAAAAVLGRRTKTGALEDHVPHNIPFVLLGCGLLWFGWYGFNGGSAFSANQIAALSFVTTTLAASTAVLTWVLLCWSKRQPSSAVGAAFAAVVGLVAITPAAGYVTPMGAILIGAVASIICYFMQLYKAKLRLSKVDDTLDVFICHGVGGVVGSLMTGILASKAVNPAGENGLLYGNAKLFWAQLIAIITVIVFSTVGTAIIIFLLSKFIKIRPDPKDEESGIDLIEHGESAYR